MPTQVSNSENSIASPELKPLKEKLAYLLGGENNAEIWLNSPHPMLGDRTPQSYVNEGKIEVLEDFIHAIATGQPS